MPLAEQYIEFAIGVADHDAVLDAWHVVAGGETASLDDTEARQLLSV